LSSARLACCFAGFFLSASASVTVSVSVNVAAAGAALSFHFCLFSLFVFHVPDAFVFVPSCSLFTAVN